MGNTLFRGYRSIMHLYIKLGVWLISRPRSLMKGGRLLASALRHKRYLATLPRSGTEYITCLLSSACDIKADGTGEYKFVNNEWVHNIKIIWPSTLHNFVANLKKVVKLWALDIDDSILEKTVELCSHEAMKSKIPAEVLSSNKRLTVRENRGRLFSKENRDYIDRSIRDKLRHDFGYNYLDAPTVSS